MPTKLHMNIKQNEYVTLFFLNFFRTVIVKFLLLQKGRWKLVIRNPNQTDQPVTITVTSGVTDHNGPIVTTANWAKKTIQFPGEHQILYVSVSQGKIRVS